MKKKFNQTLKLLFILAFLGTALLTNATSIEVKDTIKQATVWNVDTVRVTGDLYLPVDISLKIEPGTRVEFQGYYEFIFAGEIEAIGAPGDSIVFTINDTTGFHDLSKTNGGWKRLKEVIKFQEPAFKYCIFEFAKEITNDYAIEIGIDDYPNETFSFNIVRNIFAKTSALHIIGVEGIENCILRNNLCSAVSSSIVNNCIIENNLGHGAIIENREPASEEADGSLCLNNMIKNNSGFAVKNSPDIYCLIQNNIIENNYGGILICKSTSFQRIYNNLIVNNNTHGAIIIDSSDVWMTGNIIYNNTVSATSPLNQTGAVISINTLTESYIFNNTIVYNHGINTGGLAVSNFESIEVNNNILWENTTISSGSEVVFLSSTSGPISKLSLHSNLISNKSIEFSPNIIIDSTFIISDNPQFTNPDNGVFNLSITSPCINKGRNYRNWILYYLPKEDIANNYRVMSNIIDIGAYEFIPDSLLIINLTYEGNDSIILCQNNYKSVYLRSYNYWEPLNGLHYEYYQWQKNGVDIKGAIYNDLMIDNFSDNDLGNYRLLSKTNNYNHYTYAQSHFLTKTKLGKVNNTHINVTEGSDTTIALVDITDDSVTYSWYKNGIKLTDTTHFLKFNKADLSNEGYYYCKISNECTTTITDSVFLDVIRPKRDTVLNTIVCTKFEFGGKLITEPGIYYDTLFTAASLDSVIQLNVGFTSPIINSINATVCYSYEFNGNLITESGIYYDTLLNTAGCDSIIQLNLQITDTLRSTINRTTCNSYDFNGKQLTKSGIYYDTLANEMGCNSIIELNLTIQGITYKEFNAISCSDYAFKGKTYTKTGKYQDVEINELGCVTINTLDLLIPETDPTIIVSESGAITVLSDTVIGWVRCDNGFASVPNATDSTFQPEQSGSYAAIIANSGCIDTTACYSYNVSGIGIVSQEKNLLVYPNPFISYTTISLNYPSAEINEIRLFNMIGEEVYRVSDIKDNTYKLYRNKLVSGTYMLLIRSNNNIYNKRIMIE